MPGINVLDQSNGTPLLPWKERGPIILDGLVLRRAIHHPVQSGQQCPILLGGEIVYSGQASPVVPSTTPASIMAWSMALSDSTEGSSFLPEI